MDPVVLPAGMETEDTANAVGLLLREDSLLRRLGRGRSKVAVTVAEELETTVERLLVTLRIVGGAVVKENTWDQVPNCCGLRA